MAGLHRCVSPRTVPRCEVDRCHLAWAECCLRPCFDAVIMLISALIHGTFIVYGLALAWVLARAAVGASLLIGALFGLALYAVNLYGFTVLFPWFAQARLDYDHRHLVFGITGRSLPVAGKAVKSLSVRHADEPGVKQARESFPPCCMTMSWFHLNSGRAVEQPDSSSAWWCVPAIHSGSWSRRHRQ